MLTLALQAMATRFELALPEDSPRLRAAGEEALNEISRVENLLSLYKPSSEVAGLNSRAGSEGVRVSAEMFSLLERAVELSRETEGAFDITIAPLVRCWGFMNAEGRRPDAAEIEEARAQVGSHLLVLDSAARRVRFGAPGMMLDFGAFGKGYALDRAVELLREAGVTSALLHGGTSSVHGLGAQADGTGWRIAIEGAPREDAVGPPLAVVELRDESLSVSAVWGKSFASQGRTFGHILDGRTGYPSERAELAAIVLPSGADADALSAALLVDGPAGLPAIAENRPGARLLVLSGNQALTHHLDAI